MITWHRRPEAAHSPCAGWDACWDNDLDTYFGTVWLDGSYSIPLAWPVHVGSQALAAEAVERAAAHVLNGGAP